MKIPDHVIDGALDAANKKLLEVSKRISKELGAQMTIDNLTFGEIKQLVSIFNGEQQEKEPVSSLNKMIGQKVIIRTYSAGVWFGTLSEKAGNEVILTNARRMWLWKAKQSISLSAVAIHGIDEGASKIVAPVASVWLEAIEIIPCEAVAVKSLEGAEHVKAS